MSRLTGNKTVSHVMTSVSCVGICKQESPPTGGLAALCGNNFKLNTIPYTEISIRTCHEVQRDEIYNVCSEVFFSIELFKLQATLNIPALK